MKRVDTFREFIMVALPLVIAFQREGLFFIRKRFRILNTVQAYTNLKT